MPIDFSPIANAPLNAMQAAAYGDAMQANRLQNRLVNMAAAEDQRKKSVAGLVAESLYGARQQAPAPMAPQPVNQLAGPRAATVPHDAQRMPPVQAAPGSEIMGQMAQVPGGTANQLAPAAPTAMAAPTATPPDTYTAQRTRLRDLYNSGQITAQDAQTYDQQITAAEQAATATRSTPKLAILKELMGKALDAGDNESFQMLIKQAQADPDVKSLTPDIAGVTITGKQQLEVTKMFTADEIKAVSAKFGIDPNTPPGMYKITTKGGKPVAWEPKEPPAEKGPEVRSFDGIVDDLHKKNPTWDKGRLNFEAGKVWDARKVSNSQQRTKFTFDLKNSGMDMGGESDGFRSYTPQMQEQAFKDRQLGTYKYPSGMKSLSEKQAFDKLYYQWRVDGGVGASDVIADRASAKADTASLSFNTKQLDASKSFIKTIDNNIDQLESHITEMSKTLNLDRNRVLNMGTRDFNKKLVGVGNINIYDMLVSAISTENAKLQAGGAGSVAQVSEGARVDMERIHDKNLPVSEMLKLMSATRKEGGNRIKALVDTGDEISKRMRGSGGGKPTSENPAIPHFDSAKARTANYMGGQWGNLNRKKAMWDTLKKAGYSDAHAVAIYDAAKGGAQ
jgi:hypothetical protein